MKCEEHFEELVRSEGQVVTCPSCGAAKVLKQLSAFAVHGAQAKPSFASASAAAGCCGGSCGSPLGGAAVSRGRLAMAAAAGGP